MTATALVPSTSSDFYVLPAENDPFVSIATEVSSSQEDNVAEMTGVFRLADGSTIGAFVLDVCGEVDSPEFAEAVVAQFDNLRTFSLAVGHFLTDAQDALTELSLLIPTE